MSTFVSVAGLEALSRAREADNRSTRYRAVRNRAVVEALAAGVSIEQVADELGVRIAEVDAMIRAAHADRHR
jgi:hypothetical protein